MRYACTANRANVETIAPPSNRDKDAKLRRHGFRIKSRPNVGPVTWERRGKVYTEREALAICGVKA